MWNWIIQYGGTILVGLLLLGIMIGITCKLVHDKRAGKSSCSCGCSDCSACHACHSKKKVHTK